MDNGVAILIIFVVLIIRVIFHFMDKKRIEEAAFQKGWNHVKVSWHPFAPRWFFEQSERHYLVTYNAKGDSYQKVYCKTSMRTGVKWRD